MLEPQRVKRELKAKGWSYRRAAVGIGKHYTWICRVLNGQETSAPVLRALDGLPKISSETAPKNPTP